MARRANLSPPARNDEDEEEQAVRRRPGRISTIEPMSPSPTASFSSDKENREAEAESSRRTNGKSKAMPPPKLPSPTSAESISPNANKRRRLHERDAPNANRSAHEKELERLGNTQYYDPDQSMEERRAVRKGIRDLSKELNDSRAEFLAPGSDGLYKTINKANEIFASVKQTSDATLDSRLLVSAADLSVKRTTQLNLGDAQGIVLDEFVSKCATFMRRGPSDGARRRRNNDEEDDSAIEGSADEGDAFNWEWFGRQACFPNSFRPPVPGFLLGPLSVQKRARKQTQRRERLQKRDPKDVIRPEELKAQDLEKVENSNLTTLCRNIRDLLVERMVRGKEKASRILTSETPPDEVGAILAKYGLADDAGVPLFQFVINPKSFGQTAENLFYISFLIRDGTVGIGQDSNMLPTLHATVARKKEAIQEQGIQKHQAVFHLDFETWENLIEAFGIIESIIPHRKSDEVAQVSATGWYG